MLNGTPLTTNIVTTDIARAKAFYTDILGLELKADYGPAAFFNAGGAPLFIYQRDAPTKADHTVANWDVPDVRATAKALAAKGVVFERYDGMTQDEDGIASLGEGAPQAAWFKDPDGNILGIVQPPS